MTDKTTEITAASLFVRRRKIRSFAEWHCQVSPDAGRKLVRIWREATGQAHKEWLEFAAPTHRPATPSFASSLAKAARSIMLEAHLPRR